LLESFPFAITRRDLERGRERYDIFCSPCHGRAGTGEGMVVQRGFRPPPSFHLDRLREAPVGHFYDVITNGFGAMWSYASRIPPLMTVAVVPLLAGAARLYPWAGARPGAGELGEKSAYLNVPFFLARTAAYFAVWHVLARFLDKWSREEETSGAPDARPEGLSGPGLVLYGLTVTFASVDWVMSLEPHWS